MCVPTSDVVAAADVSWCGLQLVVCGVWCGVVRCGVDHVAQAASLHSNSAQRRTTAASLFAAGHIFNANSRIHINKHNKASPRAVFQSRPRPHSQTLPHL